MFFPATLVFVLLLAFQCGYHISVLNQIQSVLSCKDVQLCIPMDDLQFSFVTAIFTIGGLVASLVANRVIDSTGRLHAARLSASIVGAGSIVLCISRSVPFFAFGRFLTGFGCGIGLCLAPLYLAEISPPSIKGNIGVLTQLSIVFGIFFSQLFGLRLASPTRWRIVLLSSTVIAIFQLILGLFAVDSPAWLLSRGHDAMAKAARESLWGPAAPKQLPPTTDGQNDSETPVPLPRSLSISVPQLFKSPDLRRPLITITLIMVSQQLSGINAVLYYSNDILSSTLPDLGPYVSLAITVVNVLMTFPPIFLIERMGRRKLLQISALGAVLSLIAVGAALNSKNVTVASIAILTFVMSFAIGLGPVPFVLIPEVVPFNAVSSISSVALSVNWLTNFTVGLVFLPLRNWLAGGDEHKEGRVFYVFAAVLLVGMISFERVYRA